MRAWNPGWEQPSVELKTDPRTGTQDYFSTTAEFRVQQSLHDKEQAKLTGSWNRISRNSPPGKSVLWRILRGQEPISGYHLRLPLLDDGELRAGMLEQVENRYDYLPVLSAR